MERYNKGFFLRHELIFVDVFQVVLKCILRHFSLSIRKCNFKRLVQILLFWIQMGEAWEKLCLS